MHGLQKRKGRGVAGRSSGMAAGRSAAGGELGSGPGLRRAAYGATGIVLLHDAAVTGDGSGVTGEYDRPGRASGPGDRFLGRRFQTLLRSPLPQELAARSPDAAKRNPGPRYLTNAVMIVPARSGS